MLAPVPNLRVGAATDRDAEGPRLRVRVLRLLEESLLPGLGQDGGAVLRAAALYLAVQQLEST